MHDNDILRLFGINGESLGAFLSLVGIDSHSGKVDIDVIDDDTQKRVGTLRIHDNKMSVVFGGAKARIKLRVHRV